AHRSRRSELEYESRQRDQSRRSSIRALQPMQPRCRRRIRQEFSSNPKGCLWFHKLGCSFAQNREARRERWSRRSTQLPLSIVDPPPRSFSLPWSHGKPLDPTWTDGPPDQSTPSHEQEHHGKLQATPRATEPHLRSAPGRELLRGADKRKHSAEGCS